MTRETTISLKKSTIMSDSDGGSDYDEVVDLDELDVEDELEDDELDELDDQDLDDADDPIGSENEDSSSSEQSLDLDFEMASTSDHNQDEVDLNLFAENELVVRNTKIPITVPDKDRSSRNWLTMYELVRLIGTRTAELNGGAAPVIRGVHNLENTQIAHLEIKYGRCPIGITRHLPGNRIEHWKLSELENYVSQDIVDSAYYVPELEERKVAALNTE